MVSRFRERNVGTRQTLAVHATYNHVTSRVLYIILRDRVKKVYPNIEDNTRGISPLPAILRLNSFWSKIVPRLNKDLIPLDA